MGEFFDLAFFYRRSPNTEALILNTFNLCPWKNEVGKSRFSLFNEKTIFFETYCESDFCYSCISISDVFFTKKNFCVTLQQVLEVVSSCFEQVPSILFATGIYELTTHLLEGVTCLAEITQDVLLRFPVVFLRENHNLDFSNAVHQNGALYILNSGENVQNIYSNPIKSLMIDEGLSFEEAWVRFSTQET